MSKKTLILLVILILYPIISFGYTQIGTNTLQCNSVSDCNNAIATAPEGGTVVVSNGTYTLSSAGAITISKGIAFQAQTAGLVTFNISWNNSGWSIDGAIRVIESKSESAKINGFVFQAGGGSAHAIPIAIRDNSGKPVMIFNNRFVCNEYDSRVMILVDARGGVIFQNTFQNNSTDRTKQAIWLVGGPNDWKTADTLGSRDANGDRNVYIENNIFNDHIDQAIDMDAFSRTVIRYNTFNDGGFVTHGCTSDQNNPWVPQRPRHFEIYKNNFHYIDGSTNGYGYQDYNIFLRSGSGVIHSNTFETPSGKASAKAWLEDTERCGLCSSYPCTQQLGRGHNGSSEITEGIWIWANSGFSFSLQGRDTATFFTEGRDFFNYQKPGYSTYSYPHPLRGQGAESSESINSPTGLRVLGN